MNENAYSRRNMQFKKFKNLMTLLQFRVYVSPWNSKSFKIWRMKCTLTYVVDISELFQMKLWFLTSALIQPKTDLGQDSKECLIQKYPFLQCFVRINKTESRYPAYLSNAGSKIRNPIRIQIRIRDFNRTSNLVRILVFHGYRFRYSREWACQKFAKNKIEIYNKLS